jgi:excisionase family DNA binding protein
MELMTITEAADYIGITRQAVHAAIKKNRLNANKTKHSFWTVTKEDIKNYYNDLYIRPNRCQNEEVSVKEAAKLMGVPLQRAYYLIKLGLIKAEKRKGEIFVQRNSLIC